MSDKSLALCIRDAVVAIIYGPDPIVVTDRAMLGEDVEIYGFHCEAKRGTPLKDAIIEIMRNVRGAIYATGARYVWFDSITGQSEASADSVEVACLLGVSQSCKGQIKDVLYPELAFESCECLERKAS